MWTPQSRATRQQPCRAFRDGRRSSGSFLWAYDALLREDVAKSGDFGVFITMGPGAGVECALWRFM